MIKRILTIFLLIIMIFCSAYKKPHKYTIEAEKDAFLHNNIGLNYLRDRIYYAAIQEFKIAISLSPSTQATAIFQNNLGETYMFIGYPEMALPCFEDSIKLYGLNFKYYKNLVNCYIALNKAESKAKELMVSDNIYDRITLGIIYIETGDYRKGVNVLDEVCANEPNLLITPALKQYVKKVLKDKL